MRLRYFAVDYLEEASKAVRNEHRKCLLPASHLQSVNSLVFVPGDGNVFDSPWEACKHFGEDMALKTMVEDLQTLNNVCNAEVQHKFMSQIIPSKIATSDDWRWSRKGHLLQVRQTDLDVELPSLFGPMVAHTGGKSNDRWMNQDSWNIAGFVIKSEFDRQGVSRLFTFDADFELLELETHELNRLPMTVFEELLRILERDQENCKMDCPQREQQKSDGVLESSSNFNQRIFLKEEYSTCASQKPEEKTDIILAGVLPLIFPQSTPLLMEACVMEDLLIDLKVPSLLRNLGILFNILQLELYPHVHLTDFHPFPGIDLSEVIPKKFAPRIVQHVQTLIGPGLQPGPETWCAEEKDSMSLIIQCMKGDRYLDSVETIGTRKHNLLIFEVPACLQEVCTRLSKWDVQHLVNSMDKMLQVVTQLDAPDLDASRYFEQLIVISELAFKDHIFRSLPVPMFIEGRQACITAQVAMDILSSCKQSLSPASDLLYLDWSWSQEGNCSSLNGFILQNAREDEHFREIEHLLQETNMGIPVCGTKFCCEFNFKIPENSIDFCRRNSVAESKESVCSLISTHRFQNIHEGPETGKDPPKVKRKEGEVSVCDTSLVAPSLDELSTHNDLSFFMQARNGTIQTASSVNCLHPGKNGRKDKISGGIRPEKLFEHTIELTVPLLKLMGCIEMEYSRILERNTHLREELQTFHISSEICAASCKKFPLISLIKERVGKMEDPQEQQLLRELTALYVLQQTADNLWMYGVQIAHLLLENFVEEFSFLRELVCQSNAKLEEAYKHVGRGLFQDHPKLLQLEKIIKGHVSRFPDPKFVLVAERRALFTLHKHVVSLGLRPYQFDRQDFFFQHGILQIEKLHLLKQTVLDALTDCDCLMAPPEYMISSFPLEQVTCFLKYGDFTPSQPETLSVQSLSERADCEIHVFKVMPGQKESFGTVSFCKSLDVHGTDELAKLHVKSFNVASSFNCLGLVLDTCTQSQVKSRPDEPFDAKHIIKSFSVPASSTASLVKVPSHMQHNGYGQCDMIITANINRSNEFLLSTRRSSYQRIVAFEKEGLKVVERELSLPIDLAISPAVCLVWYTQEKLQSYDSSSHKERGPLLLSYFEDITENVMKLISFSFSDCFMIFEGSLEFRSMALGYLHYLYAAALGLGIQLQCFLSESSGATDMIVADCIGAMRRSKKHQLYPVLLETQTFAELFLTEFPSINPLTAHAILSSGIGLHNFISLKYQEQVAVTKGFDVPERSLMLFKEQCQSGQLGRRSSSHADDRYLNSVVYNYEGARAQKLACPYSSSDTMVSLQQVSPSTRGNMYINKKRKHPYYPASSAEYVIEASLNDDNTQWPLCDFQGLQQGQDFEHDLIHNSTNASKWSRLKGCHQFQEISNPPLGLCLNLTEVRSCPSEFSKGNNSIRFGGAEDQTHNPSLKGKTDSGTLYEQMTRKNLTTHSGLAKVSHPYQNGEKSHSFELEKLEPSLYSCQRNEFQQRSWESCSATADKLNSELGNQEKGEKTLNSWEYLRYKTFHKCQRSDDAGGASLRHRLSHPLCNATKKKSSELKTVGILPEPWLMKREKKSDAFQDFGTCKHSQPSPDFTSTDCKLPLMRKLETRNPRSLDPEIFYSYQFNGSSQTSKDKLHSKQNEFLQVKADKLYALTPADKRSKQTLSYERRGNEKQSQLVWTEVTDTAKYPRSNAACTF